MDTGYFPARICVLLLSLGGFASSGVCPDRCDCPQPQRLMCSNRGLRTVPSQSSGEKEVLVFSLGGNFIGNVSSDAATQELVPATPIPSGERFDLLRTDHDGVPPPITDPCVFNRYFITNVSADQVTSSTVTVYWATPELSPVPDEVNYRILFDRFGTVDRFPRYVYTPGSARSVILRDLRPDVTYMVCVEGVVSGSVCQVAPRDHCSGLVTLSEDSIPTSNLQLVTVLTLAGNAALLLVLGSVWLGRSLNKRLQRRKSAVHVRHIYSTRRPFRANVANTSASTDFTGYHSSRPARLVPPELGDLIEFPCDRFQDTGSSRRDTDLPRFSDEDVLMLLCWMACR